MCSDKMYAWLGLGWALMIMPLVHAGAQGASVELIADPNFEQGFQIKEEGVAPPPAKWMESAVPVWQINHHYSKSSFAHTERFQFRRDGLTFEDDYGSLIVHPEDGEADVIVGLNASKEFGGLYRQAGDPWPHVYLSQRIAHPGGSGKESPSIAGMKSLPFSVSVRLLHDQPNRKEGYNRSLHAAQFLLLFTVQNLNRQSPGYGDYYWLSIPLYDDREPVTALHAMQDKGSPKKKATDKLIYSIGVKPFTDAVVGSGQWVTVGGDLLPHMIAGLQEAWKRGFLPASQDLADYRLGSVILGWEVPGLNDVAIAVKDLHANAVLANPGASPGAAGGNVAPAAETVR